MKKYDGWSGTQGDLTYVLQATLNAMQPQYPELSQRELKSLLCASLSSNLVQNEIGEMMAYKHDISISDAIAAELEAAKEYRDIELSLGFTESAKEAQTYIDEMEKGVHNEQEI